MATFSIFVLQKTAKANFFLSLGVVVFHLLLQYVKGHGKRSSLNSSMEARVAFLLKISNSYLRS